MPSPHTAQHVQEMVEELLQEWELSVDKISSIITDSGSNMVAALRNVVEKRALTEKDSHAEEEEMESEAEEEDENIDDLLQEEEEDFQSKETDHNFTFLAYLDHRLCFPSSPTGH